MDEALLKPAPERGAAVLGEALAHQRLDLSGEAARGELLDHGQEGGLLGLACLVEGLVDVAKLDEAADDSVMTAKVLAALDVGLIGEVVLLKEDEQPVVLALEGVIWGGEALAQVERELLAVFGLSLGEHGVAGEALGHGGEGGLKEAELEHGEQELAAHAARALRVVEAGDEQVKELV